jgi:hypothetical protein
MSKPNDIPRTEMSSMPVVFLRGLFLWPCYQAKTLPYTAAGDGPNGPRDANGFSAHCKERCNKNNFQV